MPIEPQTGSIWWLIGGSVWTLIGLAIFAEAFYRADHPRVCAVLKGPRDHADF